MQVFFAHPKSWDDELVDEAVRELAGSLSSELGEAVTVVAGRDDFQQNIAIEGNFDGWCRSVTRRTDEYGQRVYGMIVVPKSDGVGKATAQIVSDALAAGIPVATVEWQADGDLVAHRVVGVDAEDDENYIGGWHLIPALH
jgi:hypothetical protein